MEPSRSPANLAPELLQAVLAAPVVRREALERGRRVLVAGRCPAEAVASALVAAALRAGGVQEVHGLAAGRTPLRAKRSRAP